MNETINIADLVKPKFEVGQTLWEVDSRAGRVQRIQPVRITSISYTVVITDKGREAALRYFSDFAEHNPDTLYTSLDEIPQEDRVPRVRS
ncbi:hypothetical protein DC1_00024 [Burkholderia phage DC1]|uniref:Uncharacterized protein n=1 Tax=Burkholderia phage DC1 TaxID=2881398 RepID=I6NRM0_9CAUD|nr:hypothetical protein B862_gp59 [Burkholderia phage DC1]AEZ50842.1 hypothetical protein DC1_00024 [Burkholderia phage DC1]